MKKVWKWFDGKKSLISAILMIIINSDYVAGLITDPQLYMLIQAVVVSMFAGGMIHKGIKAVKK